MYFQFWTFFERDNIQVIVLLSMDFSSDCITPHKREETDKIFTISQKYGMHPRSTKTNVDTCFHFCLSAFFKNSQTRWLMGKMLSENMVYRNRKQQTQISSIVFCCHFVKQKYSRTSLARTGLGPRKLVPVKGSSSQPG